MADKTYKLTFTMSDGSEKSVQFTVPEGPAGYTPVKGKDYTDGKDGDPGVGITNITIAEV